MQFKLKEEELAALIGNRNSDPLQQLILTKMLFGDKDDKKDEKKDGDKPVVFLGYEIKRKKTKESAGSLLVWLTLGLFAFSPYMSVIQDWMLNSLKTALH